MATAKFCGMSPSMFGRKLNKFEGNKLLLDPVKGSSLFKNEKEVKGLRVDNSRGFTAEISTVNLKKKIMTVRDILDLPPFDGSISIEKLLMRTIKDLQKLHPEIIPSIQLSEMEDASIDQVLANFCKTLKSIESSWVVNHDSMDIFECDIQGDEENNNTEQRVETALETLRSLIKIAREKFDMMDEDDEKDRSPEASPVQKILDTYPESYSNSFCASPATPTSVLPELTETREIANTSYTSPFLLSLRVKAVGKLNPVDVKGLSFNKRSLVRVQNPRTSGKKNNIVEEPMKVTKCNSEENKAATDLEKTRDQCTEVEKPKVSVKTPVTSETTELLLPSTSRPKLSPNVAPIPTPPPSPMLQPNLAAPLPPPPPPPMLRSNVTSEQSLPPPPPPPPGKLGAVSATIPPPGMLGSASAPPPPPPMMPLKGSGMPHPPPMPLANGAAAPPPPPLGVAKSLRPKKATKLKRSSQMGNLYRLLKGKVEGSDLSKSTSGRKGVAGSSAAGGKKGMADALAEMTKRSAYFQQIEEDVQKYTKSITELKSSISTFQTKDMAELLKFQKHVESILENLTDESQVLARFEGFPSKKLETLRTATALYSKLNAMATELQNWKIVAPLKQLLDKVERYFNKIKGEIETLERTKDEESKKFQSHNIHFDFSILIKIKELMVDVSSNCMELALKESREAKAAEASGSKREGRAQECVKMLWRAFQFAFRVYTFAGGHDDRADNLTRELAQAIETIPRQQ